jgi:predicted nucleotidyltransferase
VTWRVPPYDRAVDEAEAFIRAHWKVHGIVVAGSIVRGEAGPMSDLDIFVVHAGPWRVRDQRRFAGVPTELFVNPPARIRGYFESEHAEGLPSTANMFTTGVVLAGADPIVDELVREARDWMARPIAVTAAELASRRYAAVDRLDDARDMAHVDAAAAALLLAAAVHEITAYAFWRRAMFQPRRKDLVRALAAVDPIAADLVRAFVDARGDDAQRIAITLADHVLGVDTFFEWTSDPG